MGAGILFQKDGKVLLLKRAHRRDKWAGYWNCPGGSSEPEETRYETALRESREEVGPLPRFQVYDHINIRGYTLFLADVAYQFTPKLNSEHSEWRWVSKEESLSFDLHPKDKKPLSILLKREAKQPSPIPPPPKRG